MTEETFKTKYHLYAMACPFADNGDIQDEEEGRAGVVNIQEGFPSTYSTPVSLGGRAVKRVNINKLGYISTFNDFREMCGGIITYDTMLASLIGGYPKGAILKYVVGDQIMEVQSLVDNNTYDFVANGVDEIHWHLCNRDIGHIASQVLAEETIDTIALVSGQTVELQVFTGSMPITGYLNVMFNPGSRKDGLQSFTASALVKCKKNSSWITYDGDLINYGTPIKVVLSYTGSATVENAKYKISVNP